MSIYYAQPAERKIFFKSMVLKRKKVYFCSLKKVSTINSYRDEKNIPTLKHETQT